MFIVIEIQKNGEEIATIVNTYDNHFSAESKYYSVLSAAALSSVKKHGAILLTEDGVCIRSEVYEHKTEE